MPFNLDEKLSLWRSSPAALSSDEDSFGPASIPYNVNVVAMPGTQGEAQPAGRSSSLERRQGAERQPTLQDILQAVNGLRDDNAKALSEIAQTNGRVTKVEDRVTKVETATSDLEVKVDGLDLKIEQMVDEKISEMVNSGQIDEKLEEKLDGTLEEKIDGKISEKLDAKLDAALEEKINAKVRQALEEQKQKEKGQRIKQTSCSPVPSTLPKKLSQLLPKPKDKADVRVQAAFQDLLAAADVQKHTFVMGMKDDKDTQGKQILPELPFTEIFKRFFNSIRYTRDKPTTAMSNKLPLIRFVVHPEDVHQTKMIIRDRGREIRMYGWWVAQESPKDLRDMESNAVKFFIEAKTTCPDLKRVWLTAEDGFVKAAGVPILPVFTVPKDKSKWADLAPVLLQMVEDVRSQDWLGRHRKPKAVNPKLYERWGEITDPPGDGEGGEGGEEEESSSNAEDSSNDGSESEDEEEEKKLTDGQDVVMQDGS
jgi:hypothetical protein